MEEDTDCRAEALVDCITTQADGALKNTLANGTVANVFALIMPANGAPLPTIHAVVLREGKECFQKYNLNMKLPQISFTVWKMKRMLREIIHGLYTLQQLPCRFQLPLLQLLL